MCGLSTANLLFLIVVTFSGQQKRDKILYSRTEAEVDMMRSFKQIMDPNHILNPNKVLGM
jgi:FAD/FMN-containing dehydrogenase